MRYDNVVVVGMLTLDNIVGVEETPVDGSKYVTKEWCCGYGGCATNVAINLATMGVPTTILSWSGEGDHIREITNYLSDLNIQSQIQLIPDQTLRKTFVLVNLNTGSRTAFLLDTQHPKSFTAEQTKMINSKSLVYYDGGWPEVFESIKHICTKKNVPIAFNYDIPSVSLVDNIVDSEIFFVSFAILTPHTSFYSQDTSLLIRRLQKNNNGTVVLTAGEQGSCVYNGIECLWADALHIEAKDTTGAGDAYQAGFLYGLVKNCKTEDSIRYASCLGALQCSFLGSNLGVIGKKEVHRQINMLLRKVTIQSE
jgi:sugar/nucleoside kinase (ribokinase family)